MDLESEEAEKLKQVFAKTVLAKRITRFWRRAVAKRTNGYVICHGNTGVGEDGDRPTTTIYNYDLNIFYEWDHFQFKNKGCDSVLSYPYSLCTWKTKLARLKKDKKKFVDKSFPPNDSSLFHDPSNPKEKDLKDHVKKWIRISEMFQHERVFKFTFYDDNQMGLCGFSGDAEEEFFSAEHFDEAKSADAAYKKALDICIAALSHKPNEDDFSSPVFDACSIKDWLKIALTNIVERSSPLFFSEIIQHKITCIEKSGYVPQICVLAQCLFKPNNRPQLFERSRGDKFLVKPGDIRQGALGDCYYLGALSVLAADEKLLLNCFPDSMPQEEDTVLREQTFNEEGLYAMAFYKNRQRRIVVIDDWIPINENGQPAFCRPPRDSCEIWTMLAEKAYAKLHGSYEGIVGGLEKEALQDLTGGLPLSYFISGEHLEDKWKGEEGEEMLWTFLKEDLFNPTERSFVGCSLTGAGNEAISTQGLVSNHAYGVLQVQEITFHEELHRLIQIRNPWGSGVEWTGDWNDQDTKWAEVDAETKEKLGYTIEPDGTWWMNFADFKEHFNELEVCRLLNQSPFWTHHHVNSHWTEVSAGSSQNMHLNPQFQLQLVHDAKVYVELRQPSRRALGKEKYEFAIGPIVMKNGQLGKRRMSFSSEDQLAPFVLKTSRSCVVELDLIASEGPFDIIACSKHAEDQDELHQAEFYIDVYTKDGGTHCEACQNGKRDQTHTHSQLLPISVLEFPTCYQCKGILKGGFATIEKEAEIVYVHSECLGPYKIETSPKCLTCQDPIFKHKQFSGRFYSLDEGKVHSECYDEYKLQTAPVCDQCGHKILEIAAQFSGTYYTMDDGKQVHSECRDQYRAARADKCVHCSGPIMCFDSFSGKYWNIEQSKVHDECYEEYRISKAEKCLYCEQPVTAIKQRFDGLFYQVKEEGKVHSECWDNYKIMTADKCLHCNGPVLCIEGKFTGRYYTANDQGKVHTECWELYKSAKADKCAQCDGPVTCISGKYSGKYFAVGDTKIHSECWEDYECATSPACIHCDKPVCKTGTFSGEFFELPEDKRCHLECYESYTNNKLSN